MKLGVCTKPERVAEAALQGFDFAELPLNAVAAMDEAAFDALCADMLALPIYACNCMLPANLPITGPNADEARTRAYLALALDRAARLGVRVCVLGSGGARSVPQGYAYDEAWRQFARFLRLADEYAGKRGIRVALEPLRAKECNLMCRVSEAVAVASLLQLPNVSVLGDMHHMRAAGEGLQELTRAGALLAHLHVSHSLESGDRVYPAPGDGEDYAALIQCLNQMNYNGAVSVEASTADFSRDGALAVQVLRPLVSSQLR